ncbi:hypothetical protein [Cronobacter sakazakii]|uniref:hypothetical protein n=1 Tax=Cronobacter sakazakii TaxID=28141 RepID=UPI001178452C|nr:hypothetical protein [Cronobacter sakazakii]
MSEISKDEGIYRLANHIASSKNGLPDEWQAWADEIESDLRELAALRERAEPVTAPDLHKVIYHFRDLNEGFPVERFKADYVISWMLANYPPAPPAPVVPVETFEEWSRRCEIQLTLCRPEFREVAEITWNACCAAMLAAPGKDG